MALLFDHHVGLLKNVFRYPKDPDIKYLRQTLRKKIKRLKKHLTHYHRFVKAPNLGHEYLSNTATWDVKEYGTTLKMIGDLFNVKMIWKTDLIGVNVLHTVILIGNEIDIDLASRFAEMMTFCIENVVRKETKKFQTLKKAERRKKRKAYVTNNDPLLRQDAREFSRKFRIAMQYNCNLYLLELLDISPNNPHNALIFKYISRNLKLHYDNKRGNPNWNPKRIYKEDAKTAIARDLKFHLNKLLT